MLIFTTITAASGSLVDIDATLLIQLALFLIMLFLLNRLLFRPVVRLIEARREATEGTVNSALELEKKAAALNETVERTLKEVRASTTEQREQMLQAAQKQEREILADAREKAHNLVVEKKRVAISDMTTAKSKLLAETGSIAASVAAKMLNRA